MQNSIRDIAINQAGIANDIDGRIGTSGAIQVTNNIRVIEWLDLSTVPIRKIMQETEVTNNAESLVDILNASAPFDEDQEPFQITDSVQQELCDEWVSRNTDPAFLS